MCAHMHTCTQVHIREVMLACACINMHTCVRTHERRRVLTTEGPAAVTCLHGGSYPTAGGVKRSSLEARV